MITDILIILLVVFVIGFIIGIVCEFIKSKR